MPVKVQKHLLKAVGGVVFTRYLHFIRTLYDHKVPTLYKHFNSTEAWKKSMLKVKNVKKVEKSNFKILQKAYAYLQIMVKTYV